VAEGGRAVPVQEVRHRSKKLLSLTDDLRRHHPHITSSWHWERALSQVVGVEGLAFIVTQMGAHGHVMRPFKIGG
jgi:hypothetical protein